MLDGIKRLNWTKLKLVNNYVSDERLAPFLQEFRDSEFDVTEFDSDVLGGTDLCKCPYVDSCLSGCHPYPLHLGCSQSPE